MTREMDDESRSKLELLYKGKFVPRSLYFDTTNVCNANCVFCGYGNNKKKAAHLPQELFEFAVRDYLSIGGSAIGLTPIVGDPLVDPGFREKIRFCQTVPELKVVKFYSNGIALTPERIAPLFEDTGGSYSVCVSILGFDSETFIKIARVDRFKAMERNVLHFLDRLEEHAAGNIHFTAVPRCFARDDGSALFRRLVPYLNEGSLQEDGTITPPPFDSFAGYSEMERVRNEDLPLRKYEEKDGACDVLFTKPMVLADGTINCCAERDIFHDLAIGNIRDAGLGQVFDSDLFRSLVAKFQKPETMPQCCRDCSAYRSVFHEESRVWNNIMSWSEPDA